jgi:RNA polymerase sigma factor (sigma-70 family)
MSNPEESVPPGYWPGTRVSLLDRLQKTGEGDPRRDENWVEFVELYWAPVRRFCLRRLKRVDEAEEVTAIVFERVFRSLGRFRYDPERGRFGGWIGQITRNEIIRFVHKKQRAGRFDGGMEFAEIMAGTEEGMWVDEFNEHLIQIAFERTRKEVSPENWRLFMATWKSDKKPGEVAKELGVPSSRVHKARFVVSAKLRSVIKKIAEDIPLPGDME